MAVFPINVVVSYKPTERMGPPDYPLFDVGPTLKVPDNTREVLWEWGERVDDQDGDSLRVTDVATEEDHTYLPARLTLTVTCEVDAPTEWDARTDALSWFRGECETSQLPAPESVVANANE